MSGLERLETNAMPFERDRHDLLHNDLTRIVFLPC
jgi:hypothetical protein